MSETVRVAVVESAGADFVIQAPELGELRPDEILVRVQACGICHTDLTVARGGFPTPFPVVLGHEGTGTVQAVGSAVTHLQPGARVVLSFDSCGHCPNCLAGRPSVCNEFMVRNFRGQREDGTTSLNCGGHPLHSHFLGQSAFSTHLIAPARCAVKIDSAIPPATLASFGCGIQTGAGAVLNALKPRADQSIAIFGLGAVGMASVMAAKISGCRTIIAIDPVASRRALAEELGATHSFDPAVHNSVEAIRAIVPLGVDFSVESSGGPGIFRQSVDAMQPGGTCALIGTPPQGPGAEASINIFDFVGDGKSIVSILLGNGDPQTFIPELVGYWEQGRLPVERLVTEFALDQINEAVARSKRGETIKPVLVMSS